MNKVNNRLSSRNDDEWIKFADVTFTILVFVIDLTIPKFCVIIFGSDCESRKNKSPRKKQFYSTTDKVYKISNLPEHYTNVKTSTFAKQPTPPDPPVPDFTLSIQIFMKDKLTWLKKVFLTHKCDKSEKITWSSYSSSLEKRNQFEVGIFSLMLY